MVVNGIVRSISVVIMVCIINPYVLIPAILCLAIMLFIMSLGANNMVQLQRLDSLEREPIHSIFAMMITGLVSCRVSGRIGFFKQEFMNGLYRGTNAMFCYSSIMRWLGIRLDLIITAFMSSVTWFCLLMKGKTEAKILLVTLQIISDLTAWFSISIRLYTELENSMTCSQRMLDYTTLEIEDALEKTADQRLAQ